MKRILLADDDEGIVDATVMMLDLEGYEVSQTLHGQQVPEMARAQRPDLIIMDIWMSGIDGRDICRLIKSDPELQHIPVLMISASRETRQTALDAGASDFVEKPFDMDDLLGKTAGLLAGVA